MTSLADVAAADLVGVAEIIEWLSERGGDRVTLDGPAVLGQRRALGHQVEPRSCRLVATADGWMAVNLARPEDVELMPAWLGHERSDGDPWPTIAAAVADRAGAEATAAAQVLGLPVAVVTEPDHEDDQTRHRGQRFPMAPFTVDVRGRRTPTPLRETSVVDLTGLWAGPLATSILAQAGCKVVKLESTQRPDGARRGHPEFFELLNRGKAELALDFQRADGRETLRRVCDGGDVVVTASRPRAIHQLGLDPEQWPLHVAITGYGWTGPWSGRVAFGDDAGAAGGLAALHDPPRLVGDAVADPVAGLFAAGATLAALAAGLTGRIDVALRDAANHVVPAGLAVLDPAEPVR